MNENGERFVARKEYLNAARRVVGRKDAYSLMGAEDRNKWRICGCEKCKERNIITIYHS
jgi:hypothetical protein